MVSRDVVFDDQDSVVLNSNLRIRGERDAGNMENEHPTAGPSEHKFGYQKEVKPTLKATPVPKATKLRRIKMKSQPEMKKSSKKMAMNMVREKMGMRKMKMLQMVPQKHKFGDQKEYTEVLMNGVEITGPHLLHTMGSLTHLIRSHRALMQLRGKSQCNANTNHS
jgi:hypothetical protein